MGGWGRVLVFDEGGQVCCPLREKGLRCCLSGLRRILKSCLFHLETKQMMNHHGDKQEFLQQ